MNCCLCESSVWLRIPDPVATRSITTAGNLLREHLSKGQCRNCGLMQRINTAFVGDSDFYEEKYGDYYGRPGAHTYDAPRYKVMAEWMRAHLTGFEPRSILDVGCGAGWSMIATRSHFPKSEIEGVEPSRVNAELARQAGFNVHLAKIGDDSQIKKGYDLIYANNVLQHVLSPIDFLEELSEHLSDQGLLVLICPDASRPSNEMLMCDHNYSFRPEDLLRLAENSGFYVRSWQQNPDNVTVLDKQLVVLAKGHGTHATLGRGTVRYSPDRLYRARCEYVESWQRVHQSLCRQIEDLSHVYNFGSSSWTWLLAGYCPEYWGRVECCVVDRFSGKCLDKLVKPLSEVPRELNDALVLGVNPVTQPSFAERFEAEGRRVIRWDDYVQA